MHYAANGAIAFDSVEHIMRDVNYGWLLRYLHANGASMFFVAVYIHMFRGLYYGSYKEPREVLWILGVIIYLLMMATGFMGYVLPWGQMSFWGAKVIISLFGAIPVIGNGLTEWIMGDYLPSDATLNRFFALHVIALPLVLLLLVVLAVLVLLALLAVLVLLALARRRGRAPTQRSGRARRRRARRGRPPGPGGSPGPRPAGRSVR